MGEVARAAPSDEQLERTIASVPGVASASVDRQPDGRSRLRLRLHPGEDADAVSWAVAATLRERFSIALDPAAIRPIPADAPEPAPASETGLADDAGAEGATLPEPEGTEPRSDLADETDTDGARLPEPETVADREPAPHGNATTNGHPPAFATEPADDAASTEDTDHDPVRVVRTPSPAGEHQAGSGVTTSAPRAAIRDLDVHRGETEVSVTVRLEHEGRSGQGFRRAVATRPGIARAIAEATVEALRSLVGSQLLVGIDHVAVRPSGEPAAATVVLTLLAGRSEDTLLGSALLGDDPDRAVMRATLDALNRRVEPLLAAAEQG
ncbi:MAG: hypothetical protein ACLFRD_12095 [Nitriliruptoraceae bacterium]